MWVIGAQPVVVTNGYYTATKIAPNGNAALKISCVKAFGVEEKERNFLY